MARTADDFARDALGNQLIALIKLQAENDELRERVAQLEAQAKKETEKP